MALIPRSWDPGEVDAVMVWAQLLSGGIGRAWSKPQRPTARTDAHGVQSLSTLVDGLSLAMARFHSDQPRPVLLTQAQKSDIAFKT